MLLSVKYQFLYVHIAKTGGTSIRTALQSKRWQDPYYYPMFIASRFSHLTGHKIGTKFPRHSRIVAAKELLPEAFFNALFKFAVVRNPWDLQVSSYHHIKRERPHLVAHIPDFEAFIHWKLDPERPYQYHIDTSIQSQLDYVIDLQGNIVTDYLGRFETLQQDYNTIMQRLNIKTKTLPQKRVAKDRKDYRSYYSDTLAEKVGQFFQRDIDAFGYQFDAV